MIHIPVTAAALATAIETEAPGWRTRAAAKVVALGGAGAPAFPNTWSAIKAVYIKLLNTKCAFCEKKLEGRIEQDVEHFRPKGAVARWPAPAALLAEITKAGFRVGQPPAGSRGYKYLAYHELNYVTACKTCNSVRKKNYFPVAGRRRLGGKAPADVAPEQAYLIYPLSDVDTKPEKLIEFSAVSPRPKKGLGAFDRLRALVTISLFGLDDLVERKELIQDRLETLQFVYLALKGSDQFKTAADRTMAAGVVAAFQTGRKRHTNCVRNFVAAYKRSPAKAGQLIQDAVAYLKSVSR